MLRLIILTSISFTFFFGCAKKEAEMPVKIQSELTQQDLVINADNYIHENYQLTTFRNLLENLYQDKVTEAEIAYYNDEIIIALEFTADKSEKNFLFAENKLKISFEIEKSFSILESSLKYCREFSQQFMYYDLSFSHVGLACRDDAGVWHLLKRKI